MVNVQRKVVFGTISMCAVTTGALQSELHRKSREDWILWLVHRSRTAGASLR